MRFRPKVNRIANVENAEQSVDITTNTNAVDQQQQQQVQNQSVLVLDSQQITNSSLISQVKPFQSVDSSLPQVSQTNQSIESHRKTSIISSSPTNKISQPSITEQPQTNIAIDSTQSLNSNATTAQVSSNQAPGDTSHYSAKRGSRVRISINSPSYQGSPSRQRQPTKLDRAVRTLNRKFSELYHVYFGRGYEHQDVLVTTGLILILIGFGSSLLGLYILYDEHHPRYLMISLGPGMLLLGVVFCLARVIIWQPRICPCLCPKPRPTDHRKASRNSAFFTAASAAMTTATAVSIRYGKQSLTEHNDPFIQNYQRVLTSPKSAATAVLFAQKLLKGLKVKVQNTRQTSNNSSNTPPPPTSSSSSKLPRSSHTNSPNNNNNSVRSSARSGTNSKPISTEIGSQLQSQHQIEISPSSMLSDQQFKTSKQNYDDDQDDHDDQVLSVSYHTINTSTPT